MTTLMDLIDSYAAEVADAPHTPTRLERTRAVARSEAARDKVVKAIEGLQTQNARLLSDVTRPESLEVGLMRAEIARLKDEADARLKECVALALEVQQLRAERAPVVKSFTEYEDLTKLLTENKP